MKLNKYKNLKRKYKDFININPIQTGGKLTKEAKKALTQYADGYSICDYCKGDLNKITNPPVKTFINEDLPEFLNCDAVRVTHGAREGIYKIFKNLTKPGDKIIIDENRHYTTDVAIERTSLKSVKVKNNKSPDFKIKVENYESLIKKHKPKIVLLTYPDGKYGNLPNAVKLGEIVKKYKKTHLVLNCAYSIGRMPINCKELNADFVIGSGHKSMASTGPIGLIGMNEECEELTKKSRTHKKKEVEFLGCSVRGVPLITLMASFPKVVKRVKKWNDEIKKVNWFLKKVEKLGMNLLGEKPHKHDLLNFETRLFYEISKKHPKGRAFLYEELKKNKIFGVKHGYTKSLKMSTYQISKKDLKKVLNTFSEIIKKYD